MKEENTISELLCPCCGNKRDVASETPLPQLEVKLRNLLSWWNPSETVAEIVAKRKMQWACNFCLAEGRALEGNLEEQIFCDFPPYLAYFDVTLRCEDCNRDFVFSANEQKFWYETLKFWVQSRPKQCADCRRLRRERKQQAKEAQEKKSVVENNAMPNKSMDVRAKQLLSYRIVR